MELSPSERAVWGRFYEKCRIAGGAAAGYVLRRGALRALEDGERAADVDGALAALVDKGLLLKAEDGVRYLLTEAGAEQLQAPPGR